MRNQKSVPSVVLATLLAAGLLLTSAEAAERPDSRALTDFFNDVVFGAEYKHLTGKSQVVQKWVNPIRISVSSMKGGLRKLPNGKLDLKLENQRPPEYPVKMIRKHLKTLVKLTGVVVEDGKKVGKPANLFIKIVPRLAMHAPFLAPKVDPNTLKELARHGVCFFLFNQNKGEITQATIIVNSELPEDRLDACLLEEMAQTLGLPNDSDIVQPSIFNQRSVRTSLSRSDIILIATLYDEKLKPGMPAEQARTIAAGIINHLNQVIK